jgi:isochorismate synthase
LASYPEQLVKSDGNKFETISLAGTQKTLEKRSSLAKEQEEQQFVTDYIVTKLKS